MENNIDETFISQNPKLQKKLSGLGFSFSKAVAEENTELAQKIKEEAVDLKKIKEEKD